MHKDLKINSCYFHFNFNDLIIKMSYFFLEVNMNFIISFLKFLPFLYLKLIKKKNLTYYSIEFNLLNSVKLLLRTFEESF